MDDHRMVTPFLNINKITVLKMDELGKRKAADRVAEALRQMDRKSNESR